MRGSLFTDAIEALDAEIADFEDSTERFEIDPEEIDPEEIDPEEIDPEEIDPDDPPGWYVDRLMDQEIAEDTGFTIEEVRAHRIRYGG